MNAHLEQADKPEMFKYITHHSAVVLVGVASLVLLLSCVYHNTLERAKFPCKQNCNGLSKLQKLPMTVRDIQRETKERKNQVVVHNTFRR